MPKETNTSEQKNPVLPDTETPTAPKKASPILPIVIILGLAFLIFSFFKFTQAKPTLEPQSQPDPTATNAADFNQQGRLDATGASIPNSTKAEIIIYGRTSCSHCQVVDAFLTKEPAIKAQVSKKWLDDSKDDKNDQKGIMKAAQVCGIPEKELGVPLLYISGEGAPTNPAERCLNGDTPIIDYLTKTFK